MANRKMKSYIERVVRDAYNAENRTGTERVTARVAVLATGKRYLFVGGCDRFERVRQRVEYRLNNNLSRHFPEYADVEVVGTGSSCMPATWHEIF